MLDLRLSPAEFVLLGPPIHLVPGGLCGPKRCPLPDPLAVVAVVEMALA
jgi:hypothetical protein